MVYIVGHRGAPLEAPENTIKSFKKAIEIGVDYFECDIHLSKDGEIVVVHDSALEKVTNGKGHVNDFTLNELKELVVLGKSQIPTLKEVLELDFPMILDLKSKTFNRDVSLDETYPDLVKKTIDLIESFKFKKDIIFAAFNWKYLEQLRDMSKFKKMLNSKHFSNLEKGKGLNLFSVSVIPSDISSENIKLIRDKNLKICVQAIDDEEVIKNMMSLDIDYLCTGRPDLAIKIRNEIKSIKR